MITVNNRIVAGDLTSVSNVGTLDYVSTVNLVSTVNSVGYVDTLKAITLPVTVETSSTKSKPLETVYGVDYNRRYLSTVYPQYNSAEMYTRTLRWWQGLVCTGAGGVGDLVEVTNTWNGATNPAPFSTTATGVLTNAYYCTPCGLKAPVLVQRNPLAGEDAPLPNGILLGRSRVYRLQSGTAERQFGQGVVILVSSRGGVTSSFTVEVNEVANTNAWRTVRANTSTPVLFMFALDYNFPLNGAKVRITVDSGQDVDVHAFDRYDVIRNIGPTVGMPNWYVDSFWIQASTLAFAETSQQAVFATPTAATATANEELSPLYYMFASHVPQGFDINALTRP